MDNNSLNRENDQGYLQIQQKNQTVHIMHKSHNFNSLQPQLCLNFQKTEDDLFEAFRIDVGDIITLGRVKLGVKSIKINKLIKKTHKPCVYYNRKPQIIASTLQDDNFPCRICLNTIDNKSNNLTVNPCKCSGTMGKIHTECLKQWIKQQKIPIGQIVICQICKHPMSTIFQFKQKIIDIRPLINHKSANNLILQGQFEGMHNTITISAQPNKSITIGSSQSCQLTINDTFIDRIHASFQCINDQFFISDNNSQYGTTVTRANIQAKLTKNKPQSVLKIGNEHLCIKLKYK